MSKIIVTPINTLRPSTEYGKKARTDYIRERDNSSIFTTKKSKWDDSRYNNAQIGNYFAFVHQNENKMELFKIENILPVNERPEYWNIPEHSRRNVLIPSEKIGENKWSDFKEQNNYNINYKLRGTQKLNINI